jgi:dipeptidyl aminopeptidase/acylaminoacyl peptidase
MSEEIEYMVLSMPQMIARLVAAGALVASPALAAMHSVSDYVAPERFVYPELSPDGRHIAVIASEGDLSGIMILDADSLQPVGGASGREGVGPGRMWWLDDRRLFFTAGSLAYIYDLADGEVRDFNETGAVFRMVHRWPDRPDRMLVAGTERRRGLERIYEINIDEIGTDTYEWDPDVRTLIHFADHSTGEIRVRVIEDREFAPRRVQVKRPDGTWIDLFESDYVDDVTFLGLTTDDQGLLMFARDPSTGGIAVQRLELSDGTLSVVAAAPDGRDVAWVYRYVPDPAFSGDLVAVYWNGAGAGVEWLNADIAEAMGRIAATFPDDHVFLRTYSADMRRLIIEQRNFSRVGTYYLFDRDAGTLRVLFDRRPELNDLDLPATSEFEVTSADGMQIHAFHTPAMGERSAGTVILLRNTLFGLAREPVFNRDRSYYVERGFDVVELDPRGTRGYGLAYEAAGYKNFTGMADDVLAAAAWAADRQGDGLGICITGSGIGSTIGLLAASLDTAGLIDCVVTDGGYTDLIQGWRFADRENPDNLQRYGTPRTDRAMLEAASPTEHAATIRASILLMYSEDAEWYHRQHAKPLRAKMRRADGDIELWEIPNRDVGDSFGETSDLEALYQKEFEFIVDHIDDGS